MTQTPTSGPLLLDTTPPMSLDLIGRFQGFEETDLEPRQGTVTIYGTVVTMSKPPELCRASLQIP